MPIAKQTNQPGPQIGPQKKRRGGTASEYKKSLQEKQILKRWYGLSERQFKKYVKSAIAYMKYLSVTVINRLEHRIYNVVYRLGIAQSRDQARQLVNHGHITVNDKKVTIPSYEVKIDDIIKVREGSKRLTFFTTLVPQWLAKYEPPAWVEIDKSQMTGKIKGRPTIEESGLNPGDIKSIVEYYSR